LAAAEQLTATCKSIVLAVAMMHGMLRHVDAFRFSRLEEDYQVSQIIMGHHNRKTQSLVVCQHSSKHS
jgi:chaperone required for assembly of F1-ATPase